MRILDACRIRPDFSPLEAEENAGRGAIIISGALLADGDVDSLVKLEAPPVAFGDRGGNRDTLDVTAIAG